MNKKHILKPGNHQFAPGSHAIHNNDNLSDKEAEWYLQKYPHIISLFEDIPKGNTTINQSVKSETLIGEFPDKSVESELNQKQLNEDLSTTN